MVVSKERLVELYRETNDSKNKEKCFKELYSRLRNGVLKFCHFYSNTLFQRYREDFFEEAEQESQVCLLKCIDSYADDKGARFHTFYYTCLQNYLSNMRDKYVSFSKNETADTNVLEWQGESGSNFADAEDIADNKALYSELENAIERINFKKPIYKKIFKDYWGFSDNKVTMNFNYLSDVYGLSRMAIKKICDKYFEVLKADLEESGDIDKVRQYL